MDWEFGSQQTINGRPVYQYDSQSGLLALDISPGDLEKLLKKIGDIPPEGVMVSFPVKTSIRTTVENFTGVKEIKRISQNGTPLLCEAPISLQSYQQ